MQAMKINAKINGINHKLSSPPFGWMKQPYIVIGMRSVLSPFCNVSLRHPDDMHDHRILVI